MSTFEREDGAAVPAEELFRHYQAQYARTEPTHIANRLGLPFDYICERFSVSFMGREYYVSHPGMQIEAADGEDLYRLAGLPSGRILIGRYLLHATVFPQNGEFMAFRELPSGEVYARQFEDRCRKRLAERFGNHLDEFGGIMEFIGAEHIHGADEAWELEFLDGLSIRFLFWRGDEEFAPTAQILFSSNFPAAFGTYDLAEIIDTCMEVFENVLTYLKK